MTASDLIRRLHQHRQWANREVLHAVSLLTDDQLHQPFPIGQGSIWKSLVHLYAAEYVWLEALRGNESPLAPGDVAGKLPGNQQGDDPISSFPELMERWQRLDEQWNQYLVELTDDTLDTTVYKQSTSSHLGQRTGTRQADVLLHLCTHAQYTTAQLVNMLRHVGARQLPDVMLISLARAEIHNGRAGE